MYYGQLLPRGFVKPENAEPNIEGLEFYLDAFREVSSCRPVGMALAPIPFTAIVEYSRLYEIDEPEEFAYLMRRMDNCLLDLNAREGESSANANTDAKNINKR